MASYTSTISIGDHDEGESSSDDSVLSFWSSDDESNEENDVTSIGQNKTSEAVNKRERGKPAVPNQEEKERERRRREEERGKILDAAGLKLRREPPPVPSLAGSNNAATTQVGGEVGRRATRKRRAAPGVPVSRKDKSTDDALADSSHPDRTTGATAEEAATQDEDVSGEKLDTQDAYARYEQFLQDSKNRPQVRPAQQPVTSVMAGSTSRTGGRSGSVSIPLSPSSTSTTVSASTGTGGGGGGRLSGLFSRITQGSHGSHGGPSNRPTPVISGPMGGMKLDDGSSSRISTPMPGTPATADGAVDVGVEGKGAAGAGGEGMGKTWSSLVDKDVLGSISDKERKRQEVSRGFSRRPASTSRMCTCTSSTCPVSSYALCPGRVLHCPICEGLNSDHRRFTSL